MLLFCFNIKSFPPNVVVFSIKKSQWNTACYPERQYTIHYCNMRKTIIIKWKQIICPVLPLVKQLFSKLKYTVHVKMLRVKTKWFSVYWLCDQNKSRLQLFPAKQHKLSWGITFHKKPPVVWERTRQSVNYPGNTGEQGKRRVNETLIRFQFESFGFAIH